MISPEPNIHNREEVGFFDHQRFNFYSLGSTKSVLERIKGLFDFRSSSESSFDNVSSGALTAWRFKPAIVNTIKTMCFPDEEIEFLFKSKRFLKNFDASKYDLLISSSPYFSSHVIAKGLKDRTPSLYWIADYRDTFSNNATYRVPNWRKSIDRKFEKKIISTADAITTVSQAYKVQLEKLFIGNTPKVIVIPSGYRAFEFNRRNGSGLINDDLITITYFGQFFPSHYSVTHVCRCLAKITRILSENGHRVKFEFYGCSNFDLFNGLLQSNVPCEFFDRIPRHQVRELQRKSNLNLFFSNGVDETFGLSHLKLFEYLDAGKPILGIVNRKTDEVATVSKSRTNVVLVDITDREEDIERTLTFLSKKLILNLKKDHNYFVRPLKSRSSKTLAKMMIEIG